MNAVLGNWKTSLAGFVAGGGAAIYALLQAAQSGQFSGQTGTELLMSLGVFVVGLLAKDGGVKDSVAGGEVSPSVPSIINSIATHPDLSKALLAEILTLVTPAKGEVSPENGVPNEANAAKKGELPVNTEVAQQPVAEVGGGVNELRERYEAALPAGVAVNGAPGGRTAW